MTEREKQNAEYLAREVQFPPDLHDTSGQAARQAANALTRTPAGEPNLPFDVRSVYDSRPVLGRDFNRFLHDTGSPSFPAVDVAFQVPIGFIAVLREIHVWIEPTPIVTLMTDVAISAQVNGVNDPFNQNIPIGSGTTDPIDCFILADETQTIGIRFVNNGGFTATFNTRLYGNLLAKTGQPLQFEIANPSGGRPR